MGGGDLNMKKSWHPLTMTNLERVWKAEQARDAEKKRIAELRQQLADERAREEVEHMAVDAGLKQRSDRLEWMYRGPVATVDREAYLMGKKIDKAVDQGLQAAEQEREALASGPGALFASADTDVAVDLAAKIREDPLFAIRKKEEERKRALLNNPLKLGQLRKTLEEERKRRKSKKSSSSKRVSSSPPPVDDRHMKHARRSEVGACQDEQKVSAREERRMPYRDETKGVRREKHGRSYAEHSRMVHRDERQESGARHRQVSSKQGRSRSRSPISARPRERPCAELERRRHEMQQNAVWAEGERDRRLQRAADKDHKEEHRMEGRQHPGFIDAMRVQSFSSDKTCSVEDRIHRSRMTIQRTRASMDKNFLDK